MADRDRMFASLEEQVKIDALDQVAFADRVNNILAILERPTETMIKVGCETDDEYEAAHIRTKFIAIIRHLRRQPCDGLG